MRRIFSLCFVLAIALAFYACSDGGGDVTGPVADPGNTGVFRGDVDPDAVAFELRSDIAGDPDNPIPGPFLIRGGGVAYDEALGALTVILSVVNEGQTSIPEPVGLTFVQLFPEGVTVLNPDNDVKMDDGPMIKFEFENDDGMWTPGEASLGRRVDFGVGPGQAVGFISRIDVAMKPNGGSIGGMVWNDRNENGEMDEGEGGVGGVVIKLFQGTVTDTMPEPEDSMETVTFDDDEYMQTRTADDGTYRFDGLDVGFYTVVKMVTDNLRPTTSTDIQVILAADGDGVSDFLMANFGCVVRDTPPNDRIRVGDFVEATGDYEPNPDRLVARGIDVERCDRNSLGRTDGDHDDDHGDHDGDDDDDGGDCDGKSELRGPVTDIDRDDNKLAIMGTWVCFGPAEEDTTDTGGDPRLSSGGGKDLDLDDVEIGDHVRARVIVRDDESLEGYRLRKWNGTPEKVHGYVQEIESEGGRIVALKVVNTLITLRR